MGRKSKRRKKTEMHLVKCFNGSNIQAPLVQLMFKDVASLNVATLARNINVLEFGNEIAAGIHMRAPITLFTASQADQQYRTCSAAHPHTVGNDAYDMNACQIPYKDEVGPRQAVNNVAAQTQGPSTQKIRSSKCPTKFHSEVPKHQTRRVCRGENPTQRPPYCCRPRRK